MVRLILISLISILLFGSSIISAQISPTPTVSVFAKLVTNKAIGVYWENPNTTPEKVLYSYTVLKNVNESGRFLAIHTIDRPLDEKIINEKRLESYYFLDTNVSPNNKYSYFIETRNTLTGEITRSKPTEIIGIEPHVEPIQINTKARLVQKIVEPTPIVKIFNWFNEWFKVPTVSATNPTSPIFTTAPNPQNESYRLRLEPMPAPIDNISCNQVLDIIYSKDQEKGQTFDVDVSIIEKTTIKDDNVLGEIIITPVEYIQYQQTLTDLVDTNDLKQKWLVIQPQHQKIIDFNEIEIQFDITGEPTANPLDYRSFSVWEVTFTIPAGSICG